MIQQKQFVEKETETMSVNERFLLLLLRERERENKNKLCVLLWFCSGQCGSAVAEQSIVVDQRQ
jgi:hypothetical protein